MDPLAPALHWFAARRWTPFPFQLEAWRAYLAGQSGLLHAPTGTGKTYAAWMGPLLDWLSENPDAASWPAAHRNATPPLTVLWITPLRALAADTAQALQAPLTDLAIPWSLETRTGDTASAVRSRQRARLPTALITTPESLSLLLARDNAFELFQHLRAVIVDEWHELMSTKRGVQTELCLARLRRWNPSLRTWGMSATMGNLDVALQTLLGAASYATGEIPAGRLIQAAVPKPLVIDSIIPPAIERFPWSGHIGLTLLPKVVGEVETARSALIFTNTRAQTEIWYQAMLEERPYWAGDIALHHGSLDPAVREWVEVNLREGNLRAVVSTSSLDLGVDFTPVDRVFQVGSPKSAARLLQRAGRSGHQPGAESRVTCVPTNALELVEIAAARDAIRAGHIESRVPLEKPLDVLVQHMVTVALGGGFHEDELYREVRTARAYRALTPTEWAWALDFVSRGGPALQTYAHYNRVVNHDGLYTVESKDVAQVHRMSIGTIVSDAALHVQFLKGGRLGTVEESFAARLRPGDRFTISGRVVEFVRLRDMTVWVRKAAAGKGTVPRWLGGRLPLSGELTEALRARLEQARRGEYGVPEMEAVRPLLELQARLSAIPAPDDLLVERVKTREGFHLFFFPFEGRLVHEGLAALFAYRLARLLPITFTLAANDYGFELLSDQPAPLEEALAGGLLTAGGLLDDILASVNASQMARRQFREIARISGLVIQRFPGGQKTSRQLQASSGLIYDVLEQYDRGNLLLTQAQREVLEGQLESTRLKRTLDRLAVSRLALMELKRPTPFGFPLMVDRLREVVSSEKLADRVKRMQLALEKAAGV